MPANTNASTKLCFSSTANAAVAPASTPRSAARVRVVETRRARRHSGDRHGHERGRGEFAVEALRLQQDGRGEREPGPGSPAGSSPTADRFGGPGDGSDQPDREHSGGQPYAVGAEVVGDRKERDQTRWSVDPLRPVEVAPAGAGVPGDHREAALVGGELSGQREQVHAQGRGAGQRNRVPQQPATRSRPVASCRGECAEQLRMGRAGAATGASKIGLQAHVSGRYGGHMTAP